MTNNSYNAIIIGAGISGLTTALNLHRRRLDVLVLEKSDHIGGAIRSERIDGFLIEAGPNSTLETTPLLRELINSAGCEDDLHYASTASNTRYILKHGKFTPFPTSPGAFLQTKLFSALAKLRLFKEPFIPPSPTNADETVADFVLRRLGQEFLDYAINPFVAGVYAGSPEQLSVKAAFPKLHALEQKYGSLIKGQIRGAKERKRSAEQSKQSARMFSFNDGMETLPRAITQKLGGKILTQCSIENLAISSSSESVVESSFRVESVRNGERRIYHSKIIVLATPSYATSEIISSHTARTALALREIPYPPCAVVVTGFKRSDVQHPLDGFGYLIPEKEKRKILGTIFTSTIFSNRCPSDSVLVTSFVGGSRQPELALLPEAKLQSLVLGELHDLLGAPVKADFIYTRQWERAIPQYNLGHLERMSVLDQFENDHPGFYFCANYRGGISVGDCVKSADEVAKKIMRFVVQKTGDRSQRSDVRISDDEH